MVSISISLFSTKVSASAHPHAVQTHTGSSDDVIAPLDEVTDLVGEIISSPDEDSSEDSMDDSAGSLNDVTGSHDDDLRSFDNDTGLMGSLDDVFDVIGGSDDSCVEVNDIWKDFTGSSFGRNSPAQSSLEQGRPLVRVPNSVGSEQRGQ